MGQYGNQPDFGTKALTTDPTGSSDTLSSGKYLGGAALYVGTGGDLLVTLAYGVDDGAFAGGGATFFKSVPSGSFLPIIVDYVWVDDGDEILTSASDIIALY
jgi:hypothetical protein